MRGRSVAVAVTGAALALGGTAGGVAAGAGTPDPPAHNSASVTQGRLDVGVRVLRYRRAGRGLVARGRLNATLTDSSGHRATISRFVTLSAATGGGCRILHLRLDQLRLDLLGLHARLDRVLLDVTGQKRGGPLGKLFCKLASARLASAATVDRDLGRLNAAVRGGGGQALRFTTHLQAERSAAATRDCSVLELTIGPLNLDLLGLVVDLKKVHLVVTATRGGGKLGDLFCQLADDAPATTTAGTTTKP